MKKKIFSLFMIFTLCFCQVQDVYADAGSLVVAGGSIAVGGLGGAALAGLAGPVVVAVFVGMMAMGFDVELSRASQEAGMTKTEFVKSKIEQYCDEANITFGVFSDYILQETSVFKDGSIKLGDRAASQIKQFCNWLFNSEQVTTPEVSLTGTFSQTGDFLRNGVGIKATDGIPCYCCQVKLLSHGRYFTYIYRAGTDPFSVTWIRSNHDSVVSNSVLINSKIQILGYQNDEALGTDSLFNGISYVGEFANDVAFWNVLTGNLDNVGTDSFIGDRDEYNSKAGALDNTDGKSTVVNPGLIGQLPIPADKDLTIDVGDYLDAIQKVIDKLGEIDIPAVDDNDGIPIEIDVPDGLVIDPTIDKEDDTDLPQEEDQTPVVDDKPVDPEKDPELAQAPLKFDIKRIFPFCIPFDINNMLNKLSSDPVAPVYTVNWHIPIVNQDLNFTVDLTPFNDVASIARKMELLALVIGLAVVTRSLIRG